MSTYKVIQDIEAEDKILGPLSLRQFIYGLITAFLLYICFVCITKGVGFLLILFLPPALFTGFFAVPFGRDQPTEVWALAKIRFLFKPRKRLWNQSGVKELVTITVPKRIERVLTNGLSQNEVESRLKALANTIDSRGWAVKNVNVNMYAQPSQYSYVSSDRLIDLSSLPQEVPTYDVQAADDILDEHSNPIAQQFDHLINTATANHRQQIMDTMRSAGATPPAAAPAPQNNWFMGDAQQASGPTPQPQYSLPASQAPAAPIIAVPGEATSEELALAARIKAQQEAQGSLYPHHLRTVQPLAADGQFAAASAPQMAAPQPAPAPQLQPAPVAAAPAPQPMTPPPDPAILSLASNNDFNVATLAREAQRAKHQDLPPDDEVVISLH